MESWTSSLASWRILEQYSEEIATTYLKERVSPGAWERLEWHRKQGHRLVLVTATVAPMAEAMARVLGMDEVYGCGPETRTGMLSGSNVVGLSLGEKERFRLWSKMLRNIARPFAMLRVWEYPCRFWFMRICGHAIAVNPESSLEQFAKKNDWEIVHWPS